MKPEEAAFRVMYQAIKTISECGELVIVGGWVPDLHYPKQGHTGSIDVDMVLDPDSFPPEVNLHDHLLQSGYTKSKKPTPTQYLYSVPGLDKDVAVDLLTTPQHRGIKTPSIEIGGLNIESLPGLDLALKFSTTFTYTELVAVSANCLRCLCSIGPQGYMPKSSIAHFLVRSSMKRLGANRFR
ncbi:hypothetical protein CA13_18940 [Planctomycetes bacterium CA13]|uniref:Nucleotidyltransferase family protein n=1 Tax=Novipirellula herctigrandis TaxID=2527986 RepID=A0A5C5YZH2_9BACT|nr:hypothetical protein CA13_18940 [Planctomycetes bacterium CA13]